LFVAKWDWLALYVIDPGGTSGVGRGLWPASAFGGVRLADIMKAGLWETWECGGSVWEQSKELVGEYVDWMFRLGVEEPPPGRVGVRLYMEDFQLRKSHGVDLAPVRIMGGLEALAGDFPYWEPHMVPPSSHKRSYSDERLKRWGLWVRGSTHRRDAVRLLLYGLEDCLAGLGS
jgi:hypothetical protein